MIDFHTHILPGIDDGSRDIQMSSELLLLQKEQGIKQIALTPHFYAQSENVQRFLKKRDKAYESLRETANSLELDISFKLGAEVYYFPGIGRADMLPDLRLQYTDYLLLEMPFAQWSKGIYLDVKDIIERQNINVILAHVERFYPFQKDKSIWKEILELPIVFQINTGSLMTWRSRRFDTKFIKSGHKVILGSDCHNVTNRVPNMREGQAILERKLGSQIIGEIEERGEKIWKNEKV
ncbi:MAG: capsular polysaccharide biosynthesis protein [Butyrivibrio sp.]|jgi:protein-tyrosine phosphatase|nr:capsular polysaccharide biosynthesis protein [Butyrivibrio sp.]